MIHNGTIHLVDDEDSVRRSTGFMLQLEGYDVRTYSSGIEFLDKVDKAEPGCILLDVRMPGMDGLEVQAELNARGLTMPIVVLTGHGDIATAVTAMRGGAADFIEKPFEKDALLSAVETALHRLDRKSEEETPEARAKQRIAVLTQREQDVLRGLVRGHPNKTIAYDLAISPRTVEVYRANVMTKLGVHSLSEVLRLAFAAGIEG
jgi:two-component system, LuxR family, response regulator FixJ